jgi:GT2 family glycosyltransferase
MGKSAHPTVYIVVVSWNGRDLLPACLDSVGFQTYQEKKVLVVDNGSTDGTQSIIRQRYPGVVLIENSSNLGFCKANNIGADHALRAGADYIVLLNQDTEVDSRWLEELVRTAEGDRSIGAVASRIRLYSHKALINSVGVEMNYAGLAWDRGFGRVDDARCIWPDEVLGVTGCAMLLRAEIIQHLGLFDSHYFAYYEDLDLSVRLWEAGYRLVYTPHALLYHRFSASLGNESPRKTLLIKSNRWRFILKHFPLGPLLTKHAPVLIFLEVRFLFRLLRQRHISSFWLFVRSYCRTLLGLPSILRYRLSSRRRLGEVPVWWRFVLPGYNEPGIFIPRLDYRQVESDAEAATERLIMGVNDTCLGEGWFHLNFPVGGTPNRRMIPAFRCFGRSATCFLRVSRPGNYILQLHVSHAFAALGPLQLSIMCNEKEVGRLPIETYCGEWWTLQFPVQLDRDTATIQLIVDGVIPREESGALSDLGLRVNEVGLILPGSSLLRSVNLWNQFTCAEKFSATSRDPSILRASLSVVGEPVMLNQTLELVISAQNQGDTLWLTQDSTKTIGYVTIGAQLFDEFGDALGEAGPRGTFDHSVLPGECQEVNLRLALPVNFLKGRVKIDLVDEQITWFEGVGSKPLFVDLPWQAISTFTCKVGQ